MKVFYFLFGKYSCKVMSSMTSAFIILRRLHVTQYKDKKCLLHVIGQSSIVVMVVNSPVITRPHILSALWVVVNKRWSNCQIWIWSTILKWGGRENVLTTPGYWLWSMQLMPSWFPKANRKVEFELADYNVAPSTDFDPQSEEVQTPVHCKSQEKHLTHRKTGETNDVHKETAGFSMLKKWLL